MIALAIDSLIAMPDLDGAIAADAALAVGFERQLDRALVAAFGESDGQAHLLVQRTLYRINRLSFFWYDHLENYRNERSIYLARVRERIEERWQAWETGQLNLPRLRATKDVKSALRERAALDLSPPPTPRSRFFRGEVSEGGYRRLLEIFSLDALVEASQLSRTLGGVSNSIQSYVIRLLLEEYGGGRLQRKHSSYFTTMLDYFRMDAAPEAYFWSVPWEVLANINLSFLLAERKRHYLRYVGGLLYTETSVPAAFGNYAAAAARLGMPDEAAAYWTVHIQADKAHGRWMLENIALPLAELYPDDAWELLWGYEQQVLASERAAASIAAAVRDAQCADAPQTTPLSRAS